MRIVVCIKQVPASTGVSLDPETKTLRREGAEAIMNPFDTYALEQGVLLKEAHGGEVIALSMGPLRAEAALREALSCGADRAVLLNDRAFAGSDTWATSYVLAAAIRRIGEVELVICGRQAIDGDTAQVGPGLAGHLGWPQLTCVCALEESGGKSLTLRRMQEEGYDLCGLELPAVITVVKDINQPRIPSLKSRLASKKAGIPVWSAADLGVETEKLGLAGSPTRVVKIHPAPSRQKQTLLIEGEAAECAQRLVRELRSRLLL